MKTTTHRPGHRRRQLPLAAALLLSITAPALAEESLRYAVVIHSWQGLPLLRDELRNAPADFLTAGQGPVASDGGALRVELAETVSIEGKQRVELRGRFRTPAPGSAVSRDGAGVSITIERAPADSAAGFMIDAEILLYSAGSTNTASRLTARCQVPARENAWQEVAVSGAVSLWQYYTPPDSKTAPEPAPAATYATTPFYRLEVRLGQLPRESLDKLATYDPEHRRLIAELGWWREEYSTHISPGSPFHLIDSYCELEKLADENHEPRCTTRINGTLEWFPSFLDLKLRYQNQAQRKQDRRVTPLGMGMTAGEWHFQRIQDPPLVDYPVDGAWCETSWAEKILSPLCTNVAAYRLTKVSPHPAPEQP